MKLEHPESYYDSAYLDWLKDKEDRKVERVVGDIIHNMSDKEFFVDDPGDYRDFIYDEIQYWYSQAEERPIVHDYAYKEKDTQWMTWARYCYEAACRDNPLALAKYAWFCEHGVGCEQNLKTAAECYTRGAEHGEIHCIRAMDRVNKFKNEGTNEDDVLSENEEVIQYKTDNRYFRYWEAKELAFRAELLKLHRAEKIEILMETRDDPSKIWISYSDKGYHLSMLFPNGTPGKKRNHMRTAVFNSFVPVKEVLYNICECGWGPEAIPLIMKRMKEFKGGD